ncbi:hypothetical protein EKO27_g1133 [Xylaria grammica]|uniref:Uncharacterized protein n=1 Tax=Xylaria grammica TaxID=363999 RepID=A0A439DHV3_9PEZI|nr:hypothetical protein EKO27_g1133 [Xylaria grammica]
MSVVKSSIEPSPSHLEASEPQQPSQPSQQHSLLDKVAILCGPSAQLLFFLFLPASLNLPPVSPSLSPEQTAYHYVYNETGLKGGISLMLLTGAILAHILRRN